MIDDRPSIILAMHRATDCTSEDRQELPRYIAMAEAFARISPSCVFLTDHYTGQVHYISSRVLPKGSVEKVLQNPTGFLSEYMVEEEVRQFQQVGKAAFDFIHQQPLEQRSHYTFSFVFHLKNYSSRELLCRHATPIGITRGGQIWLTLGSLEPAAGRAGGKAVIHLADSPVWYEYHSQTNDFGASRRISLKPVERIILSMIAQGLKEEEIAIALFRSYETIRSCKKNLFKKLNIKTQSESLVMARNLLLL